MEENNPIREAKQSACNVCGSDCSSCACYGSMCRGCRECQGKVFHQTDGKACAIYECTVQEKGLIHCGQCDQLPCEIWMKIRDPKYSDEEFEENVRMRVRALKKSTAESAS